MHSLLYIHSTDNLELHLTMCMRRQLAEERFYWNSLMLNCNKNKKGRFTLSITKFITITYHDFLLLKIRHNRECGLLLHRRKSIIKMKSQHLFCRFLFETLCIPRTGVCRTSISLCALTGLSCCLSLLTNCSLLHLHALPLCVEDGDIPNSFPLDSEIASFSTYLM
jgi:hypothetical protein